MCLSVAAYAAGFWSLGHQATHPAREVSGFSCGSGLSVFVDVIVTTCPIHGAKVHMPESTLMLTVWCFGAGNHPAPKCWRTGWRAHHGGGTRFLPSDSSTGLLVPPTLAFVRPGLTTAVGVGGLRPCKWCLVHVAMQGGLINTNAATDGIMYSVSESYISAQVCSQ